jgi:hypothetical protein
VAAFNKVYPKAADAGLAFDREKPAAGNTYTAKPGRSAWRAGNARRTRKLTADRGNQGVERANLAGAVLDE